MKSVFSFQFVVLSLTRKIKLFYEWGQTPSFHAGNFALKTDRGYSLVEVLVAITVLLIALVGPLTIAHSGLKRAYTSREQTMAVFLAQEGLEAVAKLREDNALAAYPDFTSASATWNYLETIGARCTTSNPCGVSIGEDGSVTSGSFYVCNSNNCFMRYLSSARVPYKQGTGSGTLTTYERRVAMDVDDARIKVTSTVTWGSLAGQSVTLQTYFYNIYTDNDTP